MSVVSRPRIAITGVGMVSALGVGAEATFNALMSGKRGIGPLSLFDLGEIRCRIAAQAPTLEGPEFVPEKPIHGWSRTDSFALAAVREALKMAGVSGDTEKLGLCIGGTTSGMYEIENQLGQLRSGPVTDERARRMLSHPISVTVRRLASVLGEFALASTVCSACSSGAIAISQAAAWLLSGRVERVIAGGADGLCRLTFAGFNVLGATDPNPCRPFDVQRAGLTLGEGAGFLILEREETARARRARVLAWLSGWAVGAEAHHITHPDPTGLPAAKLISEALGSARIAPERLDYVNAHGTGTAHNDAMEAIALHQALGGEAERVFVSSSKAQLGHTLGAAGAIEAAVTVLVVERGHIPPTAGLEEPQDPTLRHVKAVGIEHNVRAAISNSFGFGGMSCVLAFENDDRTMQSAGGSTPELEAHGAPSRSLVITGAATLGASGVASNASNAAYAMPGLTAEAKLPIDPISLLDAARSRRYSRLAASVCVTAERALEHSGASPETVGIVVGTAFGEVDRSLKFLTRVSEAGPKLAPPAEFPHLVASSASGNASLYLGLKGPVFSTSDLATSAESAVFAALDMLELGTAERMLAGAAEGDDAIVRMVMGTPAIGDGQLIRSEGAGFLCCETEHSARTRGATILAKVRWRSHQRGTSRALLRAVPRAENPGKSRVLVACADSEVRAAIAESDWSRVPVCDIALQSGWHEAIGGIAYATAVGLLMQSEIDEVLVVTRCEESAYALLLARAGE